MQISTWGAGNEWAYPFLDGQLSFGNTHAYVGGNPVNGVDPTGAVTGCNPIDGTDPSSTPTALRPLDWDVFGLMVHKAA